MNAYTNAVLNQLNIAVTSVIKILDTLNEEDLDLKPISGKRSIRELLSHIAVICRADYLILNEASAEEMAAFYEANNPQTARDIKESLLEGFAFLQERVNQMSSDELLQSTTSYWGVSYTRYEWLIEMVAHVYHHRGQLHTLVTEHIGDPKVNLFE